MKDRLIKFHNNLENKIKELKEQEKFLDKHNFHIESFSTIRLRRELETQLYIFENEFKNELKEIE